jgi:hypothetical protein
MGQLRQAHCPVGTKPTFTLRAKMLGPLVAGFMLSSITVFAIASFAGSLMRSVLNMPTNFLLAAALGVCVAIDLLYPRIRPTLFNRQTPRTISGKFSAPVTGFLWGLDTGTVVSTIRASAASWAALILVLGGWGPWWSGISYAAGFCLPFWLLTATYPAAGARASTPRWISRSTESLVAPLARAVRYVRYAAAFASVIGLAVAVQNYV